MDTEKENLIALYGEILSVLITLGNEEKQIQELLKIVPENGIPICNARINILNSKISQKRGELLEVCSRGVRTFGPVIISEF